MKKKKKERKKEKKKETNKQTTKETKKIIGTNTLLPLTADVFAH